MMAFKSHATKLLVLGIGILAFSAPGGAQTELTTLLPVKTLDAVIARTSGDIAFQHIRRISLFNRLAASEAYHRAAEYVLGEVKKYGLSDAAIEEYPADGKARYYMFSSFLGWDAESGVVWMTSPNREKICDFVEMPACLCRWSNAAHVSGDLVYVGTGAPEDFEGKDVRGKIVLTSSDTGSVHGEAVLGRGALGVISFYYPRPVDYPDAVQRSSIGTSAGKDGTKPTFAFKISYRKGLELVRMLEAGQKVTLKVDIEAKVYPNKYYNVVATIPGTDPAAEEFVVTAHLCHFDPGSNDNASGAASILEIARALRELITSGDIEPPRRTIRFIWVPEMSGSYAYAATHPDKTDRMLCGVNLDMVGSYLNRNNAWYVFHRTPDSLPHFINDVVADFADYVGVTNTEDDYYTWYNFMKPILSSQGSRDSFRYKVLPFMGGSDHKIYNDSLIRVPMIFFNVWPDPYYESNQDTPDRCDPTTMRRGAAVAVASAVYVTQPSPATYDLASEVYARGLGRVGQDVHKALTYFNQSGGQELAAAYKEAENVIHWGIVREKKALDSVLSFDPGKPEFKAYITRTAASLDLREKAAVQDIWNHYQALCGREGLKPLKPALAPEEQAASKLVPVRDPKLRGPLSPRVVAERGGGNPLEGASKVMSDERASYEIFNFIDGRNSILDIRNALSAEYSPVPLKDVQRYMESLAKAGVVKLEASGRT
jgi:aminopeptidase YwaD